MLGMYPGDPGPPGSDCAGVVLRVGAGVQHMKPGALVPEAAGDGVPPRGKLLLFSVCVGGGCSPEGRWALQGEMGWGSG